MPDLLDTRIENRWIIQPNHANTLGTAHGGDVVKWMDEVGVLSAMRFAGSDCATAQIDQVNFRQPINVGETVLIEAYVFEAGQTSIRVRLRTYSERPQTGERELTTESFAVYVAIDEGEPTPVPDLTVSTERGKQLQATARDRDEGR